MTVNSVDSRVLAVSDLTVRFDGVVAVDGVTFEAAAGQRLAIIGPNGAGKTTLFRALSGEIVPTSGRVELFGRDMTRSAPYRRAQLGLGRTYQVTNVFAGLTVEENVALAAQARTRRRYRSWWPLRMRQELGQEIDTALARAGLDARRHHPARDLSHGEQRQLDVALALASHPRLLLLDEPAAGLSSSERAVMRTIIEELPPDLALLLIEHDMTLALELVEHVIVLDNGREIAHGAPDEIRTSQRVQDVYLRSD